MTFSMLRNAPATSLFLIGISLCASATAQQSAPSNLPDSPGTLLASTQPAPALSPDGSSYSSSLGAAADPNPASPAASSEDEQTEGQTKRILGIIPNFRSVNANVKLPPQTVHEKFQDAFQDSFDYSSVVVPALLAGFNQARNETPEFHQGAAGYGRYFWHSFVDQTDENILVEFIIPVATHEDTRYYTLGNGGFSKRALYAIKHVVICRNDAGKDTFNAGEVFGAGAAAGISNLYYPSRSAPSGIPSASGEPASASTPSASP